MDAVACANLAVRIAIFLVAHLLGVRLLFVTANVNAVAGKRLLARSMRCPFACLNKDTELDSSIPH